MTIAIHMTGILHGRQVSVPRLQLPFVQRRLEWLKMFEQGQHQKGKREELWDARVSLLDGPFY